jgi:hypothetical protein
VRIGNGGRAGDCSSRSTMGELAIEEEAEGGCDVIRNDLVVRSFRAASADAAPRSPAARVAHAVALCLSS